MIRPEVMALHGFTGCGSDFENLAECAGPHWLWHTPDLPGHGRFGGMRGFDLAAVLNALASGYFEAFGPGEPVRAAPRILLGYSMGGRLALHWILQRPDLFDGLVLVSASPGIEEDAARASRRKADGEWTALLDVLPRSEWLARWESQPILRSQRGAHPDVLAPVRARQLAADGAGWSAAMAVLGTGSLPPSWSRLGELAVPTLLITGEHDEKFFRFAESMLPGIADCEHRTVNASGHSPHIEQPQSLAVLLNDWVRAKF